MTSRHTNDNAARRGPNWPKTSRRIRSLTHNRCVVCGSKGTSLHPTEAHHMFYGLWLSSILNAAFVVDFFILQLTPNMLTCLLLPVASFVAWKLRIVLPVPLAIPGWQIVPLCRKHHSNGHAHRLNVNYLVASGRGWANRNTLSYMWGLRVRFVLMVVGAGGLGMFERGS